MDDVFGNAPPFDYDPFKPIVFNEEKVQLSINYIETKDENNKPVHCSRETDRRRLEIRQRQIDIGKNTVGYENFRKQLKKRKRRKGDPVTPDKHQVCSKRSWDGQMSIWRRKLHAFDPKDIFYTHYGYAHINSTSEAFILPHKCVTRLLLKTEKRKRALQILIRLQLRNLYSAKNLWRKDTLAYSRTSRFVPKKSLNELTMESKDSFPSKSFPKITAVFFPSKRSDSMGNTI